MNNSINLSSSHFYSVPNSVKIEAPLMARKPIVPIFYRFTSIASQLPLVQVLENSPQKPHKTRKCITKRYTSALSPDKSACIPPQGPVYSSSHGLFSIESIPISLSNYIQSIAKPKSRAFISKNKSVSLTRKKSPNDSLDNPIFYTKKQLNLKNPWLFKSTQYKFPSIKPS